jgi:uncharacterized iron-regulated protein
MRTLARWKACAALILVAALVGCAAPSGGSAATSNATASLIQTLLPADAILLGEQHDNTDHQRVHREVVEALVARGELAALVLEMAMQGNTTQGWRSEDTKARVARGKPNPTNSTTPPNLSEPDVRSALNWDDRAWPWAAYKPAIMAAVRAGVPVIGANLPRSQMRDTMRDASFDTRLSGPSLKAQQQLIRSSHCDLLPESQVTPMTRIQIARDVGIAGVVISASQPGKTVVLLAGSGHVDRQLGVPQHLPASLNVKAVLLQTSAQASAPADPSNAFDLLWPTQPTSPKDYCGELKKTLQK